MATSKITYISALTNAIALEALSTADREKLMALRKSLEKKATPTGERKPTKEQIANEGYAKAVAEAMVEGAVYTAGDIATFECLATAGKDGTVASAQKATALMRKLIEQGLAVKTEGEQKGKVYYTKVVVEG